MKSCNTPRGALFEFNEIYTTTCTTPAVVKLFIKSRGKNENSVSVDKCAYSQLLLTQEQTKQQDHSFRRDLLWWIFLSTFCFSSHVWEGVKSFDIEMCDCNH